MGDEVGTSSPCHLNRRQAGESAILVTALSETAAAEHLRRGVDFHRGHDREQAENHQHEDDELLHGVSSIPLF